MKERFNFRLSIYNIEIFGDPSESPYGQLSNISIDIRCSNFSTHMETAHSDLEYFTENCEFLIRLPMEGREDFLGRCPVVFKFTQCNEYLGESCFEWCKDFCDEISRDDFTSTKIVHVLPIHGPNKSTMGQFKLNILVTKKSIRNTKGYVPSEFIEQDDTYFAICDEEEPRQQESPFPHECIGGHINVRELGIETGDRVNLSEIEEQVGQLELPEDTTPRDAKEIEQLVPPGIKYKQHNPHLISSTSQSQSLAYCTRLCDDIFGKGQANDHHDTHSTPIYSTPSTDKLSVGHAVSLIRGWGKPSRGHGGKLCTISEDDDDDDDACPQMKKCLEMLRKSEKEYDAAELRHRPKTRLEQMKYCYRQIEPTRKRVKPPLYVNWPGRHPIVHYTSHKHCASKAEVVPGNMGWMWNAPIAGLKARNGWRPGYIHGHIKKLMEHFLMPLHPHCPTPQEGASIDSGTLDKKYGMFSYERPRERIITGRATIETNTESDEKHIKFKIPNDVKSYMKDVATRKAKDTKAQEVLHVISQETQYNEKDYLPWKKIQKNPQSNKQISLVIGSASEKPSKLPKYKGNSKKLQNVPNANRDGTKAPKGTSLKASAKVPKAKNLSRR